MTLATLSLHPPNTAQSGDTAHPASAGRTVWTALPRTITLA
jgi:hypothetical protein